MTTKHTIIILRETVAESVIKDIVSMGTLLGTVSVGVWLDSGVLQVIAGSMFVLWIFARMTRMLKENRMSIAEARAKLDDIEAGAA